MNPYKNDVRILRLALQDQVSDYSSLPNDFHSPEQTAHDVRILRLALQDQVSDYSSLPNDFHSPEQTAHNRNMTGPLQRGA